jgi:hypothetical protein
LEDATLALRLLPVSKTLSLAALIALAPAAQAVGFGDMFSPGRWFGGNDDDYYDEGPYGPYGPGPYGYGVPGYGPYGPPGYAPYGYPAAPVYGAPGYAAPAAPAPAPAAGDSAKDREIDALKRRIEQLESRQPEPPPVPGSGQGPRQGAGDNWPSAPAFRPMDQY